MLASYAVRARYRATEIKIAKATAERERLRALIPEEQPQKRQCLPARPYVEYKLEEFVRQESWLWVRRRIEREKGNVVVLSVKRRHHKARATVRARLVTCVPRATRAG